MRPSASPSSERTFMVADATAVTFMSSSSETRRRRSSTSRWVSTAAAKGPARPRNVTPTCSCRSRRRRKPTVITPTTRDRIRSGTVAKLRKPAFPKPWRSGSSSSSTCRISGRAPRRRPPK